MKVFREPSVKAAQVVAAYRRRGLDPAAPLRALKQTGERRCEDCGQPDPGGWCDCWVNDWQDTSHA